MRTVQRVMRSTGRAQNAHLSQTQMQTITGDHDVRSKPGAGCFGTAASAEGFEDE